MKKQSWLTWFCCFILLSIGAVAVAQTITGSVRGTVTDQSGAIARGANVTATNVDTGVVNNTVTDSNGLYNFQFLVIGHYTITASASGFDTTSIGPFALGIDQIARINAKLQVGKVSTTVKVASDTEPILNTQNATLGTTISTHTLETLPLNILNFSTALAFIPGAVSTTFGSNLPRYKNLLSIPSFNGNRQEMNDFILDGVEIIVPTNGLIGYNPAPAALQQIRVITGNADAEYGNVNGGEVILVTKGGTNELHGNLYEYFQNDTLAANTWSNNFSGAKKANYNQNQFGAAIGGPILKNKFFVFGDYAGYEYSTRGQGTFSVPTARMRAGDFSQVLAVKKIQLYNTQNGFTPYPNDQIPIVNPVAKFIFAHPQIYPLPNKAPTDGLAQNNYIAPTASFIANHQGDVRIDYNISQKDAVMGRYSMGDTSNGVTTSIIAVSFPSGNDYPVHSFVTNWVHTFSPSQVNEFRAGYSRFKWITGEPTDPSGVFGLQGNAKVGIPIEKQPFPGFSAMAFINGGGLSSFGTNAGGNYFVDNTFDYGDDFTWEHGNHITRFGVQILRYQQNSFSPGNYGALGQFNYSGQFTANPTLHSNSAGFPYADFALDESAFAGIGGVSGPTGMREYRSAFYIQDDWKASSNLTVNIGLRYAYDQPVYEVNNKAVNVNLSNPSLGTAGLEFAGKNGNSRALYNPVWTEFMPRIGFAWLIKPRIVLRGGYGTTDELQSPGSLLTQNPPFRHSFIETATVPTATSGGSPLLVENGFAAAPGNISVSNTSYSALNPNLRPALIQEFNLTAQYLINNHTSAQVGYVGELGQHLTAFQNGNQWPTPCTTACTNAPFYNLVGQYGSLTFIGTEATSNYNAMQAQIQHQQSNGLEYTVNYTWSRAMTDSPGFYGVPGIDGPGGYWQNAYDPKADYGPAGFDSRNSLSANGVYQLPFGHQKMFGADWNRLTDEVLGGWAVSGDAVLYSGFPITITGPNNANVNSYASRANQYLPLKIVHRTVRKWFGTDPSATPCSGPFNGTCAYGPELPNSFGSARVGTERAPGFRQIDLSVFKSFQTFREQFVKLRIDAFNAFNISSYYSPNSIVNSVNFGQIGSTRSLNRQIQLSVDYQF